MLLQFDPFAELDRLVENRSVPAIPMDAVRRGDTVSVFLDLPGIDTDSLDLEVERNVLTVRGERHWERQEGDQVLANERRHGSFTRRLLLGETLAGDDIEAQYRDGVLAISIPVAEAAKPRKVEVGTSGSSEAITTGSREADAA